MLKYLFNQNEIKGFNSKLISIATNILADRLKKLLKLQVSKAY